MNEEVKAQEKIEWLAPEYDHKEQSVDWFWALGVIVVTTAVTSIIIKNYFFAILMVLGGILLAYFSTQKPGMLDYELNEKGFKVRNRLYPYENIKSFWVQEKPKPLFFINTERIFMPIVVMPLYPNITNKVRQKMLDNNVPEEEMKEHHHIKIMENLGF